jgi:hypothetical protein
MARRLAAAAAVILHATAGCGVAASQDGACQTEVRSRARLVSAVRGKAYEGRVICVRAGDYGQVELTGRHARRVTVRPYPGESPVLGEIALNGVSRLRITGFDFRRGGIDTMRAAAQWVEIIGNRFHGYAGSALMTWGGDANITFEGNVVEDLRYDGSWWSGWGVSAIGARRGIRNLRIRYNSFLGTAQDAMEIGETYGGEIVGNVVRGVKPPPGSGLHTDSFMLWANSRRFLIADNRFEDGRGLLLSGSTSDVRLENNLIVRMENWCHTAGPTGSSDAGVVRYTWIRNTVYDCGSGYDGGGYGGGYGFASAGPATAGASNRAERNVFTSFGVDTARQFASEDYNVIVHGPRRGPHDSGIRPRFRDRVDYQPTNLPFAAGYRRAPAGARPCAGLKADRRRACLRAVRS